MLTSDKTFTLATSNFHTLFIFEATRVDDTRIYEKYCPTVARYWGTGGARVPYVYAIQGTVIGRNDEAGPQGKGFAEDGEPMYTLDRVSGHGVAMAFDSYNQSISDTSQTIRSGAAGNDHVGMVIAPTLSASNNPSRSPQSSEITAQVEAMVEATSVVRRLTPTECERLQGFPDGWTEGQADSHRYKQMGNAVAVPVVQWIIGRLHGTNTPSL